MAEYFSDSEVVDDDFAYDGRPYRFEPEYTDEELVERRMRGQREEQLAKEQQTAAHPRIDNRFQIPVQVKCSCAVCDSASVKIKVLQRLQKMNE